MTSVEAIINRQLLKWELEKKEATPGEGASVRPAPIVTISRQSGSRGSYFGSRLAQRLGYQRFQKEAIEFICDSPNHRQRIMASLDEKTRRRLEDTVGNMQAAPRAAQDDLSRQLCRVVLCISELGGVVLMGRGGSLIVGPQKGFHMRIVCPREKRIENLVKYKQMTPDEAAVTVDRSDTERQRFFADSFDAHIDDPHHYDMVANSSLIDVEEMVDTAVVAINGKIAKLTYLDHDQI